MHLSTVLATSKDTHITQNINYHSCKWNYKENHITFYLQDNKIWAVVKDILGKIITLPSDQIKVGVNGNVTQDNLLEMVKHDSDKISVILSHNLNLWIIPKLEAACEVCELSIQKANKYEKKASTTANLYKNNPNENNFKKACEAYKKALEHYKKAYNIKKNNTEDTGQIENSINVLKKEYCLFSLDKAMLSYLPLRKDRKKVKEIFNVDENEQDLFKFVIKSASSNKNEGNRSLVDNFICAYAYELLENYPLAIKNYLLLSRQHFLNQNQKLSSDCLKKAKSLIEKAKQTSDSFNISNFLEEIDVNWLSKTIHNIPGNDYFDSLVKENQLKKIAYEFVKKAREELNKYNPCTHNEKTFENVCKAYDEAINHLNRACRYIKNDIKSINELKTDIHKLQKEYFQFKLNPIINVYLPETNDQNSLNISISSLIRGNDFFVNKEASIGSLLKSIEKTPEENRSLVDHFTCAYFYEFLEDPISASQHYFFLCEKYLQNGKPELSVKCLAKSDNLIREEAKKQFDNIHIANFLEKLNTKFLQKLYNQISNDNSCKSYLDKILMEKKKVRIAFETSLNKMQEYFDNEKPKCFICFNVDEADVKEWLSSTLVPDLERVGVKTILASNALEIGVDCNNFQTQIRNSEFAIIACTPLLKKKFNEQTSAPPESTTIEIKLAIGRLEDTGTKGATYLLYLKGDKKSSCPSVHFESLVGKKLNISGKNTDFEYYYEALNIFAKMRNVNKEKLKKIKNDFKSEINEIPLIHLNHSIERMSSTNATTGTLVRESSGSLVNTSLGYTNSRKLEKEEKEEDISCAQLPNSTNTLEKFDPIENSLEGMNVENPLSTHLKVIEIIRDEIKENNYSNAVQNALLLCANQSLDSQVIKEVYSLLKDLLPLLNEEEFSALQKAIPKLLHLSPNFPDLQKDLAIQLASIYAKKGDTSSKDDFSFYLQAMQYYAKALKIEEEHNLKSDVHNVHYIASQIFIKIIQANININSVRINEQLRLAIIEENPEKFGRNLGHIKTLANYSMDEAQCNVIKHLYMQAGEAFNRLEQASEKRFSKFLDTIQKGLVGEFSCGQLITKCYLQEFHQFRTFFKNEFNKVSSPTSYNEVRKFQKKVTDKFKAFFCDHLLNNAFAILGDPLFDCDLRAMGSVGREEICPYSDLEWMILISDDNDKGMYDQHISFFKTLASFIELQVVSIGETAAIDFPIFTSLETKNSSGFHINIHGNPAQKDLIGSPEKIANLQKPVNQDQDYDPRRTEYTMLKTISLYQTTPDLFDKYQKCIGKILDEKLPKKEKISALTVRERRALKLIEKRLADYKKAWNVHFEDYQVINIKEQYIEVLQHLISDLALFYGIKEANTLDIIDSLQKKHVFTKESSILLKEAISFTYMLRVRLNLEYKEQKEEAYISTKQREACAESQEVYSQIQNDLQLLHLHPNEIEKLSEIYWFVIKPIFFKVSKSLGGFKKQFTKISLPETSLEESLWCEDESEAKKLIPLSKYLAIYYARINYTKKKEHLKVHLNCYKRLSQKSIFEPLRACYLQTLREEKQFSIANTLSFVPNRDGLRRSHVEAYQKLQDSLRQITNNTPSAVLITSPTLQTPLYLKPEFVNQILDIDGNIKREYDNSLHRVCRLKNEPDIDLHFKQKPNHPLMEYAIHDLTSRLTGEKTPPSELLRFEVTINGKTMVYPVLVSQTIPGKNLKEVLAENPSYKPDPKCLTRMLLNAICIRPGDGRASNFVVNNDQLFCIDNDVAFVEPIVRKGIFRNTKFCSVLFCLEKQLLDMEILQKFTSINIDLIFASWLEALVQKEELYLPLFVKEEKRLYEEDPKNKFTPTILLPVGMITTLYTQIHILQQFLQHSLNDQLISIDLLDKLITLKGEDGKASQIGGMIYKRYKDARSLLSPEERLKKATNRQAEQSLTTRQAINASLGKTPTIKEIQKREEFSLKQAQEEFMGYSLFRIEGGIIGNQKDNQTLSANFEKISQSGNPDIERQDLMLRGLDLFFSYQQKKPISITLTNCAILNIKKLRPFLHQELKYLDLRYSLVKADMVETITSRCPNLQELYLSECNQLKFVGSRGGSSSRSLSFPELEVFHIARCNNLARLKINAPKLQVLKANNNDKLKELNIFELCLNLKELYLSEYRQIQALEDENGNNLNFPQLEVLHIDKCENLKRLKINAPKLQVLNASNNAKLKDVNIAELCTNLKELYLSEYRQVRVLEGENGNSLNFPKLEVLHIDGCANLERLKIQAPKLQVLKADNVNLKEMYLSECHQIQALEDKDGQDLNFPNLEVLHIKGCNNLERLKINTPKLKILKSNNNVKLNNFEITELWINFKDLCLSECNQIQALECKDKQVLNFPDLYVLRVAKCDLDRLKEYDFNLLALKADTNADLKEIIVTFPFVALNIDNCPLLTEIVFRNKAFGKKEWEKYFGNIGIEPSLPANIEEILNKPCSFWPDKKVKETHLLVLIPNAINGMPFTVNYLVKLIQKPKSGHSTRYEFYSSYARKAIGDKSYPSHWVLMTRDIITGSRGKYIRECSDMIANHRKETGIPYELPNLLEATASILMHYVKTGERLYADDPWTYTYSQDVGKDNLPLGVGGFAAGGLSVGRYDYSGSLGVAGCWKF